MGRIGSFFRNMRLKVAEMLVDEEEQEGGQEGDVVVIDKDEASARSFRESVVNDKDDYVRDTTLKESIVGKMQKSKDDGLSPFYATQNEGELWKEEIERKTQPLTAEGKRVQEQIEEACKRFKTEKGGGLEWELEPPFNKRIRVRMGEEIICIDESGMYSPFDTPYYLRGTMSKSACLTRLMSRFDVNYLKLFIDFVTIYDISVYAITSDGIEEGNVIQAPF